MLKSANKYSDDSRNFLVYLSKPVGFEGFFIERDTVRTHLSGTDKSKESL